MNAAARPGIRPAERDDDGAVWALIEPVIRAGETYALPRDMTRAEALAYWCGAPHLAFLAERDGRVLGTYFLTSNHKGGGDHVANCGYVTAPEAAGQGVARAMLEDSLARARAAGFLAMQFNFVVATNVRAIAIWQRAGFAEVGRVPSAFRHPSEGLVDALILHRAL